MPLAFQLNGKVTLLVTPITCATNPAEDTPETIILTPPTPEASSKVAVTTGATAKGIGKNTTADPVYKEPYTVDVATELEPN
jgi:hypothetical protein